jgi:hypothetical protein
VRGIEGILDLCGQRQNQFYFHRTGHQAGTSGDEAVQWSNRVQQGALILLATPLIGEISLLHSFD